MPCRFTSACPGGWPTRPPPAMLPAPCAPSSSSSAPTSSCWPPTATSGWTAPWDPPAAWWPDHPGVVAGRDRTAGGTWMGINRHGVVAAVLNRPGTLGPAAGKRSRGELPLLALDAPDRRRSGRGDDPSGCRRLARLQHGAGGPRRRRVSSAALGHGRPAAQPLPPGVSMITAHDPNDLDSPRVARHLPRFARRRPRRPGRLAGLARDPGRPARRRRRSRSNVVPRGGFGTVCSSFVALPRRAAAHMAVRRRPAA